RLTRAQCEAHPRRSVIVRAPSVARALLRAGPHPPQHSFPTRRSSDLGIATRTVFVHVPVGHRGDEQLFRGAEVPGHRLAQYRSQDRKSTRLNSSHVSISYAVFCLTKKTCTEQS